MRREARGPALRRKVRQADSKSKAGAPGTRLRAGKPGRPAGAVFEEGRLAVDALERARVIGSAAWRRLYESRGALDKAKPALLHAAGDLLEAFAD